MKLYVKINMVIFMDDLKALSTYELGVRLNNIVMEKSNGVKTNMEIAILNNEWNRIVYELWDRIPSLANDVTIQPINVVDNNIVKKHVKTK